MTHLRVTFRDDSQMPFSIGPDRGWRIDPTRRVLVIGRGVPRIEVPLDNVKYYEIEECKNDQQ